MIIGSSWFLTLPQSTLTFQYSPTHVTNMHSRGHHLTVLKFEACFHLKICVNILTTFLLTSGSCICAGEERDCYSESKTKATALQCKHCTPAICPCYNWKIGVSSPTISTKAAEHRWFVYGLLGGHESTGCTRQLNHSKGCTWGWKHVAANHATGMQAEDLPVS